MKKINRTISHKYFFVSREFHVLHVFLAFGARNQNKKFKPRLGKREDSQDRGVRLLTASTYLEQQQD